MTPKADATLTPDLVAELTEIVERKRIYHVLTSYCRALDRCDVELMKAVYWPDGYDDHGVFAGNAQEFAEFIIKGIQDWFLVTTHAICNIHMDFETPDLAFTESYLYAYHKVKGTPDAVTGWFGETYMKKFESLVVGGTDQDFLYGGRYFDRFEKRGGIWRIAKRTVVMDWNINQPSSALYTEGMFKTLQIQGSRGPSDPIYER